MIIFDATMLALLIWPGSGRPIDPNTGEGVADVEARIAHFIDLHQAKKDSIGIPTPVLSEVLVRAGSGGIAVVEKIKDFSVFRILPFDESAAIEMALMTRRFIDEGDKRAGSDETWAKIKFDRQILAIARVHQAVAVYSDDHALRRTAALLTMPTVGIADLPLPPKAAQGELPLAAPSSSLEGDPLAEIEEIQRGSAP